MGTALTWSDQLGRLIRVGSWQEQAVSTVVEAIPATAYRRIGMAKPAAEG